MTHLGIDIVFLVVVLIFVCLLGFCFASIIYIICRSVDKCLAKHRWFHHRRAYVSAKNVHYVQQPIIRANNPFYVSPGQTASQSAPATPKMSPRRAQRHRGVSFSDNTVPLIPVSQSTTTLNAEAINEALGLNLTEEQQSRLRVIIQPQSDSFENPSFENSRNVYDLPPNDVDSSFSDSSIATQIEVEVPLIHLATQQQPTRPEVVLPTAQSTPVMRQKPPRKSLPTRSEPEASLPVRCIDFLFIFIMFGC